MRRILICTSALVFVGCGDLFNRNIVARAGGNELTADWLAEAIAEGEIATQPTAVERWAWLWVQYSLYLQRLAEGDSLVDTTTVLEAMWPEVLKATVNNYYDRLLAERLVVTEATIDSAYNAGDHRLIDHILVAGGPRYPPDEDARRQRLARSLEARLRAGSSWEDEAQHTDDPATRNSWGRLGIITVGETMPEFEQTAFSLAPGEMSGVVQTEFGYHIIRRPALDDVRDEYREAITGVLVQRWKEEFLASLEAERELQVLEDGPAIMRYAADRPIRILASEPGDVIGTYEGGKLTDVTFVGWLQALPSWEHMSIEGAGDEELKEMARIAMQNDILYLEAKSVGTRLRDEQFAEIKRQLNNRLKWLRSAMRVDSVLARAAREAREGVAREVLFEYTRRVITTHRDVQTVPPFLARKLRAEEDWEFSYPGLNRAIRRSVALSDERSSKNGGDTEGSWE
jgi:hypothetical protein